MQLDNEDAGWLWDMLQAARAIWGFVSNVKYEQYLRDRMLQLAVERSIEIIGEAARRVSENFKQAHPEIQWRSIIAQRNVLAHEYGEIRQDRIWYVATVHIPDLIDRLEALVPSPPKSEE